MEEKRYYEEDFPEFLGELVSSDRFADSKEKGIAKLTIDKGYESLSEPQKFVLKKAISHYVFDECKRCGCDIPWCEMSAAEDNGSLCSWCQQLGRNDKD